MESEDSGVIYYFTDRSVKLCLLCFFLLPKRSTVLGEVVCGGKLIDLYIISGFEIFLALLMMHVLLEFSC